MKEGHKHGEGQWYQNRWLPPLPLVPDDEREMPFTAPDELCALHKPGCRCKVCSHLPVELKRRLRRKARGQARYTS